MSKVNIKIMKNTVIISLAILLLLSCSRREQKEVIKVNPTIVSFVDDISKNRVEEAFSNLFVTNKLISTSTDQGINVIDMFSKEISNKGKYVDYEIIKKSKIGEDVEYYSIIFKYEYMPIRVSIVIYKPFDKWILFDFAYDSDFLEELFETGKAYRLLGNID